MMRFFSRWIPALLFFSLAAPPLASAETTRVVMQTNLGDIVLELDSQRAPATVENFLRYANEGFYDGTVFHRIIKGFMIQGGGFGADYARKPTHEPVKNEADNGLKNKLGTIAMARTSNPHSATAQFFINHKDNSFLDYPARDGWGYAVFGKVIEGMDVVDKIANQPTEARGGALQNAPKNPVIIERVTVNKASN
jgi:cyclophilin family peptidyl-prolyl cis-trans isomerase